MELLTRNGNSDLAYDIAVPDRLPELGLHDRERRHDPLGAVAEAGGAVDELPQPPDVRERRLLAVQGPGRDQPGAGVDRIREDPDRAADGPRPDPRLGLDDDGARRGRLRLVADGDVVRVEVTIPAGSEAEVVIPKLGIRDIKISEGGKTIWADGKFVAGAAGITGAEDKDGAIRIKTGGGRYVFVLEGN